MKKIENKYRIFTWLDILEEQLKKITAKPKKKLSQEKPTKL